MKKNAWRRICALRLAPLVTLTFLSIVGTVTAWGSGSGTLSAGVLSGSWRPTALTS